jgi:NAD(P)-dependent dehydrogenase (short-subunit alcohol dehydrogenase family)
MAQRVAGKVAIVVGAGQTPGLTAGNGRATAGLLAGEGARVLAADRDLAAAEDTVKEIAGEVGEAPAVRADVTDEDAVAAMTAACVERWGRIDILHNNVVVSKHSIPAMREQGDGVITNISSIAANINYPYVAYRTSKAGVVTLTEHIAITNAAHGIRATAILPGLIDTPMAIENRVS